MRTQGTNMTINSIIFESNDPEVLLKGTINKGLMSYESDIIISHSQLNSVLNQLQRINSDISVNDFLRAEKMYNDEMLYTADFSELDNNFIELDNISGASSLKQIRA